MAWVEVRTLKRKSPKGKPVKTYLVHWRDGDGEKHRSEALHSRVAADNYKIDVEDNLRKGGSPDPKRGRETFGSYYLEMMKRPNRNGRRRAQTTLATHDSQARKWILPALGDKPLASIQRHHVEAFIRDLEEKGAGPRTREACMRLVRSVIEDAVSREVLVVNRARSVPIENVETKPIRWLSIEELEALAAAAPGEGRFETLIRVLGYCGPRIGEMAALRVGNVDTMRGRIQIESSVTEVHGKLVWGPTKGKRSRTINLAPSLRDELVVHLKRWSEPKDPQALVFPAMEGGTIRRTLFRERVIVKAAARAEITPPPTTHHLRHTAAAIAILAGWHDLMIAEMLGHSDPNVTKRIYEHLAPQLHTEGLDRLEALIQSSRTG